MEIFEKNRRLTNSEFLKTNPLVKVSEFTIGRLLKRNGLETRIAKRTFLLTEPNKVKRLKWANVYACKSRKFWNSVIFSDESKIKP